MKVDDRTKLLEPTLPFFGPDLTENDRTRLKRQLVNFTALVKDGKERTLHEVAKILGIMETSASARYRDLKRLGGSYEKRRDETIPGLWHYRVTELPK